MLRSVSSISGVEQIIKEITSEDPLCRKFYKYSHLEEGPAVNLIMGMGFISSKNGLSEGLPLDCLNMILVAKKIRERLHQADKESILHLLIADHMAYATLPSLDLKGNAEKLTKDYAQKLSAIIENLGMQAYTQIHLSSDINQDQEYQKILENISKKKCTGKEIVKIRSDASNRYYFEHQTALVEYFRLFHQCKIKISWTRYEKGESIQSSTSYDEAHFDRIYPKLSQAHALSFVYVDCGHNIHDQHAEVPYYAASIQARLLFEGPCPNIKPETPLGRNILTYFREIYPSRREEGVPEMNKAIESLQSLVIKGDNHGKRPTLN